MVFSKRFISGLLLIGLSVLMGTGSALASNQQLVLEEFFLGKTVGKGVFESGIAGVNRPFTVYLKGTWNRKTRTLRLREDFVYEDGERDTKTWFFEKTANGNYIGQRADVKGPAIVKRQDNGNLVFTYVAEVPLENSSILLRFNDVLTQIDGRTVQNTAHVVKGGFPIGTVKLTFKK